MTVSLITPTQERALSDALVSAIKSANAGMGPNESLAKSACEHGLTPEFACRMTEAYNASRTVKYLQSTEGEKRAENFDLADRDTVLKLMYLPAEEKQATAKASTLQPGRIYTSGGSMQKAASAATPAAKPYKAMPAIRENKITKLASLHRQLDLAGQELRMELAHCKDQIAKAAETLETALRVPGSDSFSEVEKRVVSTYGRMGKKAMDIIWSMHDFERLGEKRAAQSDRLFVMGVGPAYDAARDMMSWLDKAARVDAATAELNEKKRQIKTMPANSGQVDATGGSTFVSDPGMPRRPATAPLVDTDDAIGDSFSSKSDVPSGAPTDKVAASSDGFSALDPTGVISAVAPKSETTPSIMDPTHEGRMRSVRTRLMMNDMISNDPVLAAYPPEHVFNAYNDLSRIAPGVSNEPVMVRSLVGRILQTGGRMDTNEVKQLLDAEKAHREIRVKGM